MHVWFLQRLIGRMKAAELIYTGEPISALDASSMGLITKTVPAASLKQRPWRMAAKIAAMSPLAIKRTRKLFFEMEDMAFQKCQMSQSRRCQKPFPAKTAKKRGLRFERNALELAQQINGSVGDTRRRDLRHLNIQGSRKT